MRGEGSQYHEMLSWQLCRPFRLRNQCQAVKLTPLLMWKGLQSCHVIAVSDAKLSAKLSWAFVSGFILHLPGGNMPSCQLSSSFATWHCFLGQKMSAKLSNWHRFLMRKGLQSCNVSAASDTKWSAKLPFVYFFAPESGAKLTTLQTFSPQESMPSCKTLISWQLRIYFSRRP